MHQGEKKGGFNGLSGQRVEPISLNLIGDKLLGLGRVIINQPDPLQPEPDQTRLATTDITS